MGLTGISPKKVGLLHRSDKGDLLPILILAILFLPALLFSCKILLSKLFSSVYNLIQRGVTGGFAERIESTTLFPCVEFKKFTLKQIMLFSFNVIITNKTITAPSIAFCCS